MGNTFTVMAWGQHDGPNEGYRDMEYWRGESFIQALIQLRKAKREGYGCVTLYWR